MRIKNRPEGNFKDFQNLNLEKKGAFKKISKVHRFTHLSIPRIILLCAKSIMTSQIKDEGLSAPYT